MMKTLNSLLAELYRPEPDDQDNPETKFFDKHKVSQALVKDGKDYAGNPVNGAPYKASNKYYKRSPKHGYDAGNDMKIYEEVGDDVNHQTHKEKLAHVKSQIKDIGDHIEAHEKFMKEHSRHPHSVVYHPAKAITHLASGLESLKIFARRQLKTSLPKLPKSNDRLYTNSKPKTYIHASDDNVPSDASWRLRD